MLQEKINFFIVAVPGKLLTTKEITDFLKTKHISAKNSVLSKILVDIGGKKKRLFINGVRTRLWSGLAFYKPANPKVDFIALERKKIAADILRANRFIAASLLD
jgi:hypothetical protein